MAIDLTQITTPYGLLDPKVQKALREHGGPFEYYAVPGKWVELDSPEWLSTAVYRVKPPPPKPREWWIVLPESGAASKVYISPSHAACYGWTKEKLIRVREVLE